MYLRGWRGCSYLSFTDRIFFLETLYLRELFWSFRIHLDIYVMKQILHFIKYKRPREYKITSTFVLWFELLLCEFLPREGLRGLVCGYQPINEHRALLTDRRDLALVIFPFSIHSPPYSYSQCSQCQGMPWYVVV